MAAESRPRFGSPRVGLCLACRHGKRVETPRSVFWLCDRSAEDSRYEKYPRLPVLDCAGYEPRTNAAAGAPPEDAEDDPSDRGRP